MPAATDADAETSAHANEGDTSNGSAAEFDAKMNRAIVNHQARLEKKIMAQISSLLGGDALDNLVSAKLAKLTAPKEEPVSNHANDSEKLTLKALQEQHKALEQKFQLEQKARQEADNRAKDASRRAQVQAEFAKYVPADSPHHKPYMATLFDVEKRFAEGPDGKFGVKFAREWGDEVVGLESGLKELFDTDLKYLVTTPSKAPNLPPNGYRQANGNPYQPQRPQQNGGPRVNPLYATIAEAVGEHHPEAASQILNAGIMPDKK